MNIIIEKGIPVPHSSRKSAEFINAVKDMEIDDSFIFRGERTELHTLIYAAKRRLKHKFTSRTVDGGIRVWRTQ